MQRLQSEYVDCHGIMYRKTKTSSTSSFFSDFAYETSKIDYIAEDSKGLWQGF